LCAEPAPRLVHYLTPDRVQLSLNFLLRFGQQFGKLTLMNLENDHNVYILGAGFSADAGLPLIPNFLTRMRDSHPWLIDRGRIREADAIQAVLEFRLKATAAGYWTSVDLENLEELFSLASVEGTQLLYHMRYAIAATLDFCKQTAGRKTRRLAPRGTSANDLKARFPWLGEFTNQAFEVPSYAFYMARLLGMFNNTGGNPVGQNTFITFNYDTLVEDGFHHLKVPFNYGFDPNKAKLSNSARACFDKTAIKILKLHGSINWQYQLTDAFGLQDCPTIFGDYNEINNAMVSPEIVPPTWRKVFDGALS